MLADKRLKFGIVALLAILAIVAAACTPSSQSAAGETADTGAITVIGRGEAFGKPDQANVSVGVEIFAETVEEATNENRAILDRVMGVLEEEGIAAEDIQTSNYSLWAEQRHDEEGYQGITGYRVSNQVNVTVRDINNLGAVLAAVTEAGANSINGVYFSVSDAAALEARARALAMEDARARAEELSGLAGLELGAAKLISEIIGQPPIMPLRTGADFAIAESAVPEPGISPGQLGFQAQVQVTFNAE
jgi:uncharacterized protein YggE